MSEQINYFKFYADKAIDQRAILSHPPIAINITNTNYEFTPFVTYGNFSAIKGKGKSMKSFFKTALEACYIGGKAQNSFENIHGLETKGKLVLSFDTEMGEFHVQQAQKRVLSMVGVETYAGLRTFALREFEPAERVEIIDGILSLEAVSGRVGLVTIDGIADLVSNVNDLKECNALITKLMQWSTKFNIAIVVVIHENHDGGKATGHLGSSIIKKCETTVSVAKSDEFVSVIPFATRNRPFDEFNFSIDENGLPYETTTGIGSF